MTAEAATKPKEDSKLKEDGMSEVAKSDSAVTTMPKQPGPGRARPVMLHRAIVGSFERFIAILTEHFAGRWPFWLSPRQILIVPVMSAVNDYVLEVQSLLRAQKMNADVDISGNTMQKKIKMGQLQLYNFVFGMSYHSISICVYLEIWCSAWCARKRVKVRQHSKSGRPVDTGQRGTRPSRRSFEKAQSFKEGAEADQCNLIRFQRDLSYTNFSLKSRLITENRTALCSFSCRI